jgi:hypothetical protein
MIIGFAEIETEIDNETADDIFFAVLVVKQRTILARCRHNERLVLSHGTWRHFM